MNNILVITMGTTWQVVPELLGFTNPKTAVYKHSPMLDKIHEIHSEYNIYPVDETFVITTGGEKTNEAVEKLKQWEKTTAVKIKLFRLNRVEELATVKECSLMADYIYRVVLYASEIGDKLYLSLAGGRKTMSAEMQQAGMIFGCSALLHVVDRNMTFEQRSVFNQFDFTTPMPEELSALIMPLVISPEIKRDTILDVGSKIQSRDYPYEKYDTPLLYSEVHRRIKEAKHLLFNYSSEISGYTKSSNFRALYALPPDIIKKLQNTQYSYEEIKKLPKAELHCHFGGIATPEEMIEIAKANKTEDNAFFREVRKLVEHSDIESLKRVVPNVKELRKNEPYNVAGFLKQFNGYVDVLKKFIYGDGDLKAIGIEHYERLGDLQGSGLLQSKASIRKACHILADKCREHNVKYIEVRCSPINYTRGELCAEDVVKIMMDEFTKVRHTYFNLLFIASRHSKLSSIYRHIELAEELLEKEPDFRNFFAGFDLAGAEGSRSPKELREAFLPLMEKCIQLTIHAGETEDVTNIWEAVYHLNADRIGHGLKLTENTDLIEKFKSRKIGIEMCPSSNDQIVGFDKNYPLKEYLESGLHVTVNTDNPGISLTDFSREYIKASELSKEKLSKWDILLLIRNSFRAAFLPFSIKQRFILNAENEILKLIMG